VATTHIVLLRGINVGTHNRIAMAALRDMLTGLGYTGVRTLLNSGNAVVTAPTADPAAVAGTIHAAISDTFGLSIGTVVRSRAQIDRVIRRNPMPDEAARSPKFFHVGFGEPAPSRAAIDAIDAASLLPEKIALDEGTLYLWFANGMQKSPLAKTLGAAKIDATVTMRNWNTVGKLLDLADS
jgi:uncharacterized protein (DUF1697 family)